MAAEYLERMGARIAHRRQELGLSQEEVARQMPGHVTGARISLWERGKNRPRDDSLEALAKVLRVDVGYFMADKANKTATPELFVATDNAAKLDLILTELNRARDDRLQALTDLESARVERAGMQRLIETQNELLARQEDLLAKMEARLMALEAVDRALASLEARDGEGHSERRTRPANGA